ncbi:hypothetical protein S7711_11641, partial [Stachybotrys chartarum IBT 7711]
DIIKLEY